MSVQRLVGAALAALALSACAGKQAANPGSTSSSQTIDPTTVVDPFRLNCPGETKALALSLSADFVGQPTQEAAARSFVAQPWQEGFDVATDAVWTAGPTDSVGTTLTADGVALHAVQLKDNTWAIDTAERYAD